MMDTLPRLTPLCGRSVVCADQRRGRAPPPPLKSAAISSQAVSPSAARSARQRSRGLVHKQADLDTDPRIDSRNSSSASVEDVLPLAPNLATPPPICEDLCVSWRTVSTESVLPLNSV